MRYTGKRPVSFPETGGCGLVKPFPSLLWQSIISSPMQIARRHPVCRYAFCRRFRAVSKKNLLLRRIETEKVRQSKTKQMNQMDNPKAGNRKRLKVTVASRMAVVSRQGKIAPDRGMHPARSRAVRAKQITSPVAAKAISKIKVRGIPRVGVVSPQMPKAQENKAARVHRRPSRAKSVENLPPIAGIHPASHRKRIRAVQRSNQRKNQKRTEIQVHPLRAINNRRIRSSPLMREHGQGSGRERKLKKIPKWIMTATLLNS